MGFRRVGPVARPRGMAVGRTGDRSEVEADAVAADVSRRLASTQGPEPETTVPPVPVRPIRRMAAPSMAPQDGPIGAEGGALDQGTELMLAGSRSQGRPLPDRVRDRMEGAFGVDLGGVGVHTGSAAKELNVRLGARAFTSGKDIYFRNGLPSAYTRDGLEMLAHELTHVVQQGEGSSGAAPGSDAGPGVISRMTINGLGATKGKDGYAPGDGRRFKQDLARVKQEEMAAAQADIDLFLIQFGGTDTVEEFDLLFDAMAGSDAVYTDVDDFLWEMRLLGADWGGQKLFYEKPLSEKKLVTATSTAEGKQAKGAKGVKDKPKPKKAVGQAKGGAKPAKDADEADDDTAGNWVSRSNVKWQSPDRQVRLYSARGAPEISKLQAWAGQNGIKTTGFDKFTGAKTTGEVGGPFHGHFGDRSHTVKYARQKKGGGLICIVLTKAASNELRKAKQDPGNVAMTGGEGSVTGGFGFKTENTFVSVAIGEAAETWAFLKTRIEEIIFEDVAAKAPAPKASAKRTANTKSKPKGEAESKRDEFNPFGPRQPADDVLEFDTWQTAAHQYLQAGTRIRITGHVPDISYRIFELRETYDPRHFAYPDLPPKYLKWVNN